MGNDGEGRAVLAYGRPDISLITGTHFERSLRHRTGIPGLFNTTTRSTKLSMPVVGLEAWFKQISPVTGTWLALSVLQVWQLYVTRQMAILAHKDITEITDYSNVN